ncbi:bifunctional 3'-5' exonuclease/DNA polymerase [Nakamurella sp.]|uniref:bifunctional 3'-5' exonuclease/DNA polymerase n=1 Tax=Nakamurella sp. TaxID=1869182 RepID=UPI003B3AD9BC
MLACAPLADGRWAVRRLTDDGEPAGEPEVRPPGALGTDATGTPDERRLWASTPQEYPALLAAGQRVARCHDVAAVERILLGRAGAFGDPVTPAAVVARSRGEPVPAAPAGSSGPAAGTPTLFDLARAFDPDPVAAGGIPAAPGQAGPDREGDGRSGPGPSAVGPSGAGRSDAAGDPLELLRLAYRDQRRRAAGDGALALLLAAENAAALAAAELGAVGLPWRRSVHLAVLEQMLGARPALGGRPPRLVDLSREIDGAFGFAVNPDSAVELREAFRRVGFDIETTRSWVIKGIDHPAVGPVLAYKELARLHSANGWTWLDQWVRDDRFRAEYLSGAVVSGRWATRGGGALQIPRLLRQAVVADDGYRLVVADAAQLEPRVLAAISGDAALQAVSAARQDRADLYAGLAADGFGGNRASAKVAMLGAMYGQTTGEGGRLVRTLRARYPVAMGYVDAAARAGERGDVVASVLGRTCPPPGASWEAVRIGRQQDATAAERKRADRIAGDRGRFTRNFVVQASAADWAAVWLAGLRTALTAVPDAELVFFLHDELIVHAPAPVADEVAGLIERAAEDARRLVFPGSAVVTPVRPVIVDRYADAK